MNLQSPAGVEPIDIEQICAKELKNHGWELAYEPVLLRDGKPFVQRVRERVAALCAQEQRIADETLVRWMVQTEYGCLLHRAVSLSGQRVQNRALEETMAYSWPEAIRYARDRQAAEDAIVWAVNLLWQNIHRCQPEKYFPYFVQILRNEIKQDLRKNRRVSEHEINEIDTRREDDSTADENKPTDGGAEPTSGNGPYELLELELTREPLIELLRDCLKHERRLYIIISKIFLQLNATEIAAQLRMAVSGVYVETSRALDHIRKNCREMLWAELRLRLDHSG